jgi:GDP-L-fucose synthase
MRILVTGGNGYIGKSIYENLKYTHEISLETRQTLDLTDSSAVDLYFSDNEFDIVIHCAVKGGIRLYPDDFSVLDANLQMYYNLLKHSSKFKKFIHIGSGAELHSKHTPYGLSKHVIRASMFEKYNFYNLRVFGVFDENELETRFIHSNIKRYIQGEAIQVNEIKKMDFIYMNDFLRIIELYLTEDTLPKELNCCYATKVNLMAIASMISNLDTHTVPIHVNQNSIARDYIGTYDQFISEIPLIGLETGIKNVYTKLKERYATN